MKISKIIIGLIVLAFIIVIGLFFFDGNLSVSNKVSQSVQREPVPIVLTMHIDAERSFTAQAYWTEDDLDKFNGKQSVRQKVSAGQSDLKVTLPTDIVHRIRFDFGSKPGKVSISNAHLSGLNPITLDMKQFNRFSKDVQSHELSDGILTITSDLNDPYVIYGKPVDVVTD